jgi:hypothetical protein
MSDARQLLADAQAAEVKGDKAEAIRLLRRAAEVYRDKKLGTKALKVLRHIRRLEGKDEDAPSPLEEPVMPFETQVFEGPQPARTMPERGPVLADPKLEAWCSFCCRPHTEVGRLVQAPTGTFICAGCIKAAKEMLG